MSRHNIHQIKRCLNIMASCILLLTAGAAAIFFFQKYAPFCSSVPMMASGSIPANNGEMEADLDRLSLDSYDSVLLSMHSTAPFSENDFATFCGTDTVVTSHTLRNAAELSAYLNCIFCSGNTLSRLYLCLDPWRLWTDARRTAENWEDSLTVGLYSYIDINSDISFEILLPYPYISYWLGLEEEHLDILLSAYNSLINSLSAYPNVKIFFPGVEEWLMINPDNYDLGLCDANEIVTRKILLYTFCDSEYQITSENRAFYLDMLLSTVEREKNTPSHYPDLSGQYIVFLGDSVLGNFPGSFSIPGYISGLSGAYYCNLAAGGANAVSQYSGSCDFLNIVEKILAENTNTQTDSIVFSPDKKLLFVINYGFNDYFNGSPVENPEDPYDTASYKGSLRTGISQLRDAFPDASFVLMSPTHTSFFENGTLANGEAGGLLPAYVDAMEKLAAEMDLFFLDNYNHFIVTEENLFHYLPDGCHPNEKGRLAIAVNLMNYIEEHIN